MGSDGDQDKPQDGQINARALEAVSELLRSPDIDQPDGANERPEE